MEFIQHTKVRGGLNCEGAEMKEIQSPTLSMEIEE